MHEPRRAKSAWLAAPLVVFTLVALTVGLVARQTVREPYTAPFFHPFFTDTLQMKAWLELSCALADSQKARGRRAAEHALALARRLDTQQPDRFMLYHALSRAAGAAAQAADLATAGTLLDELLRLEDPSWPAHRLLWGTEAAQWVARD